MGGAGFLALNVFVFSVADSAYWAAHHSYFIYTTKANESGSKFGKLMAIPVRFSIVGPFLGGFIITNYNWHLAFLFSVILLIIASGALLFSKEIKIKTARLKINKILDLKQARKNITYALQGAGFITTDFIWPVLLFINSIQLVSIGLLYLISNTAYSFICYIAGRRSDKKGIHKMVRFGSLGHSVALIVRALIASLNAIKFWQFFGGFFAPSYVVALESGYYRLAHHDRANRIDNREFYMNIGRSIISAIAIILLIDLPDLISFKIILIIGALAIGSLSLSANRKSPIIY